MAITRSQSRVSFDTVVTFQCRFLRFPVSPNALDPDSELAFRLAIRLGKAGLSRELSQALMEPILGQFNITTRQTMANSSKNPNADDRGPPDQSFVSRGTRWKKKSMDGAASAEVQRARADWRPYGIFPRAFSRHRCVPRENKTIFGILATRA